MERNPAPSSQPNMSDTKHAPNFKEIHLLDHCIVKRMMGKGWTGKELASALGLSPSAVYHVLNGNFPSQNLDKYAAVFGCTTDDLYADHRAWEPTWDTLCQDAAKEPS